MRRGLASEASCFGLPKKKTLRNAIMNKGPDVRLITQIARLYHEEGLSQTEMRKFTAILAGLRGKWINTLVTDQYTADRLAKHSAKEQRFASSSKVA
jgi:Putative sugar-binding domain